MKNNAFSRNFLVLMGSLALTILMAGEAQCRDGPLLLAGRPGGGGDVYTPPAPPPDIRHIPAPPPFELRQILPPDELRQIAPPPDVGVPAAGQTPPAVVAPELRVITIGVSNSSPRVGERVVVNARLRNSGTTTVKRVKVRFFAGDRQVGERSTDMPPGNSGAGVTFIPDSPGPLQVKVTLDRGFATATRTLKVRGEARVVAKTPAETRGESGDDSGQGTLAPRRIHFKRPELAKTGKELPGKEGGPGGIGDTSGRSPGGPPGFKDPTGGWADKNKPKGVPEKTPWGSDRGPSKSDLGDGIEGLHDQGDLPKKDHKKGIPDPKKGPSHKTAGHGWGKDPYGQPVFKTPGGRDKGKDDKKTPNQKAVDHFKLFAPHAKGIVLYKDKNGNTVVEATWDNGNETTDVFTEKGQWGYTKGKDGIDYYYDGDHERKLTPGGGWMQRKGFKGAWTPWSPGQYESPHTPSSPRQDPRQDPQLILKLTKMADKLTKGDSQHGDPRVSDPVPTKGGKAASGPEGGASPVKGQELAAAGAGKAEAKWRFGGKKPGSGVTDPAEWQDRKIRDLSMARIKHFEVIDPVEAPGLQSVLAKSAARAGGGPTLNVTSVAGGVQKLTTQEGKQGWAPLKAGDKLSPGSAIRLNPNGGEVGTSNLNVFLSLKWTLVQQTSKGKVYLLQSSKSKPQELPVDRRGHRFH